jgi:hypothetical protein
MSLRITHLAGSVAATDVPICGVVLRELDDSLVVNETITFPGKWHYWVISITLTEEMRDV